MLDKKGYGGAILMDLSKAFDTLNHDLLIAKLFAYGFEKESLKLIRSYLSNRWQRTKIGNSFSSWTELIYGVPQGSILGPLLFNIYLNDLFFIDLKSSLCNYADDNTLYACDLSLEDLILKLELSASLVIDWFKHNHMKLNESKCHLLVCSNKVTNVSVNVGTFEIKESDKVKLLGVLIDKKLNFNDHMYANYKKAGKKLSALSRLCNILPLGKRQLLMKAYIMSQFSFSPLIGMFFSRKMNSKINALHHRALKIVYRDEVSTFDELLIIDNSVTIHQRNIQFLGIELYKVKSGIAPPFMSEIFGERENEEGNIINSLRSQRDFYCRDNPKSLSYGLETLRYLGPKIWNIIPENVKSSNSLKIFKIKIKKWKPIHCPCRICKIYVKGFGYL